jgi:DNA-binding response OmpR family regulator
VSRRILLIEDNRDVCNLLGVYFRAMGYELLCAQNCAEGIAKAVTETPELIITDLNLPDMNGVQATEILKDNPATAAIPIIMLTASWCEEWKMKALKAGVAAYVVKPISLPDLVGSIRKLIEPAPVLLQPPAYLQGRPSSPR